MAEIIKSLIASITTRFNGNSSVPHDHPNQSKLDGHPIRPKPDFSLTDEIVESEELLKDLFERWLSYYGLSSKYRHDKAKRFELFKETARCSHKLNKENSGCTFGVNKLSAMTPEEFENQCLGLQPLTPLQWKKILDDMEQMELE